MRSRLLNGCFATTQASDRWVGFLPVLRIRFRGSVPLTNGSDSGSGSRSCFLRQCPSGCNLNKFLCYFAYYFLKLHIHNFSKMKVIKKSQNSRNQAFFYYFCVMIEGSGAGSRRPKNIRVPESYGSGSGSATLFSSNKKTLEKDIYFRNSDSLLLYFRLTWWCSGWRRMLSFKMRRLSANRCSGSRTQRYWIHLTDWL